MIVGYVLGPSQCHSYEFGRVGAIADKLALPRLRSSPLAVWPVGLIHALCMTETCSSLKFLKHVQARVTSIARMPGFRTNLTGALPRLGGS